MRAWLDGMTRIGNTIEMQVGSGWIKGIIVNGERTGDGIVNMETADGKKYWCGVASSCYRKTEDSLGDLITQADRIRAMSDEELAEFINMVANDSIGTINGYGTKDYTEIWEERKPTLQWLKSEEKE